jgi:hypothetical protein
VTEAQGLSGIWSPAVLSLGTLAVVTVTAQPMDQRPSVEGLVRELKRLREQGLLRVDSLDLPQVVRVARELGVLGEKDERLTLPVAELLLKRAVDRLEDGPLAEQATTGLGLASGLRGVPQGERRRQACDIYNEAYDKEIVASSYRKGPETAVFTEVALELLALHPDDMRLPGDAEQVESLRAGRLEIDWLGRFESYYRIWTPLAQLKADLEAVLETRRNGGAAELMAEYSSYAFFAYTRFSVELERFLAEHGGMWVLTNQDAEVDVADAVHQVWWYTPLSERDDSWLRMALGATETLELHEFLSLLERTTPTGPALLAEWREWCEGCSCAVDRPHPACRLHQVVHYIDLYLDIIEAEWQRVAGRGGTKSAIVP